MWHLPREILNLAFESLSKLDWKKHQGWLQWRKHLNEKLESKWEINIKDTLNKIPFRNLFRN